MSCNLALVLTYHARFETWLILPLQQFSPIDTGEEMMSFDLGSTACSQPSFGISIKKFLEEIFCGGRDDLGAWEMERFL